MTREACCADHSKWGLGVKVWGRDRGGTLGPHGAVLAALSTRGCFLEEDSASRHQLQAPRKRKFIDPFLSSS